MNKIVRPIIAAPPGAQPLWQLPDVAVNTSLEQLLKTYKRGYQAGSLIELDSSGTNVTYCVLSGWVSLSKSMPDGQRQTIDFALPGDILSQISAHIATRALQMETVTYATIAMIPGPVWARLGKEFPQLAQLENRRAAEALSRLSDRMLRLGKCSAETRIAHALIELCSRLRSIGQGSSLGFQLPLTQQQLGEFTGLSSVHVCRTLRRLSQHAVIKMGDHMTIEITDMDALADLAGVEPTTLTERCH
ncbi:Crp/Fnr family transcriptional regulator [Yoonia sp.]|uniref:Crp/Fnr family transcriptional regulator n=1 Tax=Yoonia sp. TaxID=2212373 RepID=UPI003F6D7EAF